jgi:hypothetical protein
MSQLRGSITWQEHDFFIRQKELWRLTPLSTIFQLYRIIIIRTHLLFRFEMFNYRYTVLGRYVQ